MADLDKIFSVAKSTYSAFQEAVGRSGEEFKDGRTIRHVRDMLQSLNETLESADLLSPNLMRYKATGYMYKWELHFEVEAVDVATGIRVCVDDYLNCDRAIEVAVDKVLEEVKAYADRGPSIPVRPAIVVKELTLRNLENALTDVPLTLSTTSSLGRALQVPEQKITEFRTNYPRDIAFVRTEILRYWLDNGVCSWGAVTGAMYAIGERELGEKLRMYRTLDEYHLWFGRPSPTVSSSMSAVAKFFEHTLKQVFPPIRHVFAYGSAVVEQHGRPMGKMLDLVFVVDNPTEWHKENLQWNRNHYSFLKRFNVETIVQLQRSSAGMYYNTLVNVESHLLKYGVISTDDLLDDLLNWKWLYISGRLHKPVLHLTHPTDPISTALECNHQSAALCSVLLQPNSAFTEEQLYTTIAGLSYNDDFRQWVGEDRHKIRNIVSANISGFSSIYKTLTEKLVDYSSGQLIKKPEVTLEKYSKQLPSVVRDQLKTGKSLDEALRGIVRWSSISQSSKGVLTAGMFKTVNYSFAKVQKMVKSYFN